MAKDKCPECPDEGLPGWMGTFADMMTLLFAFFVLMFSMATMDPVKYSAFQESEAEKQGGSAMGKEEQEAAMKKVEEQIEELKENNVVEINGKPIEEYKEMLLEEIQKEKQKQPKGFATIKKELAEMIENMDLEDSTNVVYDTRGLALEIDGDLCFGKGSVIIEPGLKSLLDKMIEEFMTADNDSRPILIEGHTDNELIFGKLAKKYPSNWQLSSARASVVVQYMILNGVQPGRLTASGYADQWPSGISTIDFRMGKVTPEMIEEKNEDDELKAKNRRIKIIMGNTPVLMGNAG